MDFAWNDEQQALRKEVIRFAKEQLNDDLMRRDREEIFSRELWQKCADFGILGIPVPTEYGGSGGDTLTTVCALEALGYVCKDNGLLFSLNAHMWTTEIPLMAFGTEEQKLEHLTKIVRGEIRWCQGYSEPGSGSDLASLQTKAVQHGDYFVINGQKVWTSYANLSDWMFMLVRTDPNAAKRSSGS